MYHVYARGNDGARVFVDSLDRRAYLLMLEIVVADLRWHCLSYCLMDNHVHLLLRTPHADLSIGMQRIQGRYAQGWNRRHDRSGHVFQGRYGAVRMRSDSQVCAAAAYIARNPVEAGLSERPDGWPWSSYRATLREHPPSWLAADDLLSFFGQNRSAARKRLMELTSRAAESADVTLSYEGLTP